VALLAGRVDKKGPPEARRAGLRALALVLAARAAADPPLQLDADRLLARELAALDDRRGRALKAVEDLADANVCAYVALWWWRHGPAASLVPVTTPPVRSWSRCPGAADPGGSRAGRRWAADGRRR